jgi:hypothetical protein
MARHAWIVILLVSACGEPILRNAPHPNPAAVAGVAAATAAAITLASPQAAAAAQEQKNRGQPNDRSVEVTETVPPDVFDRLDQQNARDAGVDGRGLPSPGSAAEGQRGSNDGRGLPEAGTSPSSAAGSAGDPK